MEGTGVDSQPPPVAPKPPSAVRHHFVWYALGLLALAVMAGAVWLLEPRLANPPRTITLATGPAGGAYAEVGLRYQEYLARHGVKVRLLPTDGDVENLAQLRNPRSGVSVAFVQAGMATPEEREGLESLGTVMYSPLWLFQRADLGNLSFEELAQKRVNIGPEGSGTRFVVLKLLALAGVHRAPSQFGAASHAQAEQALLHGDIDALAILASWESPVVRRLAANPEAQLINLPRVDAFVALNPDLSKLVVPMGVGDLSKNLPRTDVALLATNTNLGIREELHPALQYLLLEAASEIHGGPGIFQRAGQFPAGLTMDLPLSSDARHFYKSGPPFLHRYLPFSLAVLVERLLILLIPLLAVLYPAFQILPRLYDLAMQRRVYRHYRDLKQLEAELERRPSGSSTEDLAADLERLEERADRLRVPMKFTQSLYTLKQHIELVRARLSRRGAEAHQEGAS
jgi:TRAP-type uncharacterized transport system substrate-binding protein